MIRQPRPREAYINPKTGETGIAVATGWDEHMRQTIIIEDSDSTLTTVLIRPDMDWRPISALDIEGASL